jgi:predicted transcriptional regulator
MYQTGSVRACGVRISIKLVGKLVVRGIVEKVKFSRKGHTYYYVEFVYEISGYEKILIMYEFIHV